MEASIVKWFDDASDVQRSLHMGFVDYHEHRIKHFPSLIPPIPPDLLRDPTACASIYMCKVARIVRAGLITPGSVPCACRGAWDLLCVIMHQYETLLRDVQGMDHSRYVGITDGADEQAHSEGAMDEYWPALPSDGVGVIEDGFSHEIGMLENSKGIPLMDACTRALLPHTLHAACNRRYESSLPEIHEYGEPKSLWDVLKCADKRRFWDDTDQEWKDERWDLDRRQERMFDLYYAVNSVRLDLIMIIDGLFDE